MPNPSEKQEKRYRSCDFFFFPFSETFEPQKYKHLDFHLLFSNTLSILCHLKIIKKTL